MIENLMALLIGGDVTTVADLAARLSIDTDLLEQMLGTLESGGYLSQVPIQCEHQCSGCPEAGLCAVMQGGRVWSVTDKGRRLANQAVGH